MVRASSLLLVCLGLLSACTGQVQKITALDRTTHDAKFPILTGAHSQADCNDCHGLFDSFTQFTCRNCHLNPATDNAHSGMPGYSYDDAACYNCHPRGDVAGVAHDAFFPIGDSSKHAGLKCVDCHTTGDKKKVDCIACHDHSQSATTPQHTLVGGFQWTGAMCLRCHADGQVNQVAGHGGASGFTTVDIRFGSPHHKAECLKCHSAARTDKTYAADFKVFDCKACHAQAQTDTFHQTHSVTGYAYDNPSCLLCHPTGDRSGTVNHAAHFPIATGDKHNGLACGTCHVNPATRKVVDCTNCHTHAQATAAPQHNPVGGYAWQSDKCLRCHADSQVFRVVTHGSTAAIPMDVRFGAPHYKQDCLRCHPGLRTDKPFGTDFGTRDCLGCHDRAHMDDVHSGESGYSYSTPVCLTCHRDGRKPP